MLRDDAYYQHIMDTAGTLYENKSERKRVTIIWSNIYIECKVIYLYQYFHFLYKKSWNSAIHALKCFIFYAYTVRVYEITAIFLSSPFWINRIVFLV